MALYVHGATARIGRGGWRASNIMYLYSHVGTCRDCCCCRFSCYGCHHTDQWRAIANNNDEDDDINIYCMRMLKMVFSRTRIDILKAPETAYAQQ